MSAIATDRVKLIREGLGVMDGHQGVEGHRLTGAGLLASEFEFTARTGTQVAVAGGVDEDRGGPGLTAGLGFRHDCLERPALPMRGDDPGVELDFDAGGDAQLLEDQFHLLRVVGHAIDPVAIDGVAFTEPTHEFLVEARLVEIEEVAQ